MDRSVRTRFAPSPTGYLHVGGLRTALFNYLFSRKNNGVFILRIEDTDQSRFVEGAAEQLMASLKWAGLQYDEGPDAGGGKGPYVQSQRLEIYRTHLDQLLANGQAYYCFCTSEELDAMRERQQAAGEVVKYDGTWRDRPDAEVQANIAAGKPYVVRMKMPLQGETRHSDLVRGEVVFQNELVDDQVLLKSDGFPTYHLANVVDDHLMEITHIIRGEEWLNSVPKHLQLYRAFGWEPPQMAHLPLLLNADRSKLSKRQGDVAVEDYRDKGYLPAALVNFVAFLGWNPGDDREVFSLEELVEAFDLARVNKAGAVFDVDKLNWLNGMYIRQLDADALVALVQPFLADAGVSVTDSAATRTIILSLQKKLERANQAAAAAEVFYRDTLVVEAGEAAEVLRADGVREVLESFLRQVHPVEKLGLPQFKDVMKKVQQETGIKGAGLWQPMRVAITGMISGPELPVVIEVFGKEKVCRFVQQALQNHV